MTTYAQFPMTEAFDLMVSELDVLLGRVLRRDPLLVLERESDLHWIVVDVANEDAVMRRTATRESALAFMRAFAVRHPEATVALPQEVAGEPMAVTPPSEAPVTPAALTASEPASPAQHSLHVRHLQPVEAR